MYLNKALVLGNLTRDPELRALPNGGSVCSFSIATNHSYTKADGTMVEDAQFHNIVVFGRQAESCAQYLKKGGSALVEGRLQTRTYEKDGQKQYRTEIVADRVQFGPRKEGRDVADPELDAHVAEEEDVPF
jgi:single-strand DNA-binding protein